MMSAKTAKYAKLIMVTGENNNMYYEMTWDGSSPNFNVKYGRVESTSVTTSYPIYQWDSKYNEKVKKGYRDVTQFVTTEVTDDKAPTVTGKIADSKVDEFLTLMKKYTDNLVSTTYSVKCTNVTQAQVDAAQKLIDQISDLSKAKKLNEVAINEVLLELYTTIPRRMSHTKNYLLPNIPLDKHVDQEQANLDAMASQVSMLKVDPKAKKEAKKKVKTLLDVLGITMKETSKSVPELKYLMDQIKDNNKVEAVFEVNKPAEDDYFTKWVAKQKDKRTRMLIHGTKCTSVVPILEIGLKIRPAGNFQFSGKVYGDGNYFSEVVQKSMGYTGYDKDKVLLVYEVHTGNPFVYEGWYKGNSFSLTYNELQKRGFDSTHVNAGNGLLNSEIIAYKEEQNRIKYIIWLK